MVSRADLVRLVTVVALAASTPARAVGSSKGSRAEPAAKDKDQLRATDRARAQFPQLASWFRLVGTARFDTDGSGRLVPDYGALTHRRVRRADNAGHAILPRFPPSFEQALGVGDYDRPDFGLEIEPLGSRPASAALEDGVVVYRDAFLDTDVFYKATPTHLDEYFVLRSAAAPSKFRFRVGNRAGIATLAQAGSSVEARDAGGVAWLRASPPIAVDRAKHRRVGTLRLEGDVLTLAVDTRGLVPPILVDPDWKSTGDMAYGRFYHRALELLSGRVLVTGGCSAGTCSGDLTLPACPTILTQAEALDLDARTWSTVADTAVPRFFHSAELLLDGRVLVAGGCTDAGCATPTADAEIYNENEAVGRFVATAPLSVARAGAASARLADGRVLIAGGCTRSSCSSVVDIYDSAGANVTPGAPMQEARGRATVTVLDDGRVLVAGGCTSIGCGGVLSSAEIYDPDAGVWTLTAPMSTPRAGHAAALLADGRVVVAGGCADTSCSTVLSSVEYFDPASGAFSPAPSLAEARFGAAALGLPDGSALVSEGCEGRASCDVSNELLSAGTFALTSPAVTMRAFHELVNVPDRNLVVAIGGCQPDTCSWWNETWDVSAFSGVGGGTPDASTLEGGVSGTRGCTAPVRFIAAGWDHTLAIDTSGALWAWGQNSEGELGSGSKDPVPVPVLVGNDPPFVQACGGARHSCGVRADGTLWCWGANYEGQLGVGDVASRTRPTQVGMDRDWASVACGGLHSCGLRVDGTLWCWGANAVGQLGQGGGAGSTVPLEIASDHAWRALSTTTRHTCALRDDGTLWCWGDNSNGQLGTGDTETRASPTQVGGSGTWTGIGTGALHTCAIDTGSALWCWGANDSGQLGLGDTVARTTPTLIAGGGPWIAVGGGFAHTCALGADHSLSCWGDGSQGQLGNGSGTSALTPEQVGQGSDWSGLALGYAHTCALTGGGAVSCWGDATWGQLTGTPGRATGSPVASCGTQPARAPVTTQCGCSADTGAPGATAGAPILLGLLVRRRRRANRRRGYWVR